MNRIVTAASALALAFGAGQAVAQEAPPADAKPAATPAPAPFMGTALSDGPWDFNSAQGPIHVEVLTRDLVNPWGMAFLPGGGMLVTERPGRLRIVASDGTLDPEPVHGLPDIFAVGIAGLNDVVLDPDFENNHRIYMAYSKPNPSGADEQALAVVRAVWDGNHELREVEDIFVAEPWYGAQAKADRCCGQGPAFGSFGGRLLFDGEGHLFVTSGDRNYGEMVAAQDNHFGKILRLNTDGSVPADNPWIAREGARPEVWSTGHRNPLGLTINPVTGDLWDTEFGPRGGDELNRIMRGGDYGWMSVTQGFHYNGEPAEAVSKVPGKIDPVLAWGPPSLNPGNLAFYKGEAFPGWQGDLLLATFTEGLLRYDTDAQGMPLNQPEILLKDLGQRWRDVRVGPDGAIYLLTDMTDGAIIKVTPAAG